jgi:hypothetical protein
LTKTKGPPHLQRYCTIATRTDTRTKLGAVGQSLIAIRNVLCGDAFISWLQRVCNVRVRHVDAIIRRFRPGLDYTVARMTPNAQRRVCVTWCWVGGDADKWEDGTLGAFQVITDVDSDGHTARKEAEVYTESGAGVLRSVSAGTNVLTVAMCEANQVEFIRYVSAGAPSSRWDVHVVYSIEN